MPDHALTARLVAGFVVFLMVIGLALLWIEFLEFTGVLRRRSRGPAVIRSRLAVIEVARIDNSRRLLLVKRDQIEHLIVVGGPNDVVLESRIVRDAHAQAHQPAVLVPPPPPPPPPKPAALIAPPQESPIAEDSSALRLLVELTTT